MLTQIQTELQMLTQIQLAVRIATASTIQRRTQM